MIDSRKFKTHFTSFMVYKFRDVSISQLNNLQEDWNNKLKFLDENEIILRGIYDIEVFRFDADIMFWLHAETAEKLQLASHELNKFIKVAGLKKFWSAVGTHREAEFNAKHIPGFIRGENAREWLTIYPFVRSLDWYILPDEDRKEMLKDHGIKGSRYKDVVANTVATFALSDYEWLLPMESDNLLSLVDMMRALRATEARKHVREEVPFFTGKKINNEKFIEIIKHENNE